MNKTTLGPRSSISPDELIRLRDSIYSADLLITAIAHFDFFSKLEEMPLNIVGILNKFQLKERPADVMLTLFKSMGLIKLKNDIYSNTELAKEYFIGESERSLVPYYSTLAERSEVIQMLDVLRTGKPAGWSGRKREQEWSIAMERNDFAQMFTSGMDSRGAYFSPGLADTFDFSKFTSVLDIAGGSGIYAINIKKGNPSIRAGLLEKTPVDKVVRKSLKEKGLSGFLEIYEGDMFKDEYPSGFDIHLYSHVFHDWPTQDLMMLARKSFRSLNPGGIIMIHDAHINRQKTGPMSVAEYSVLVMFATNGKCYAGGEREEILSSTGFNKVKFKPTLWNRSIITGVKE